jgi:mono/diheme cytochrome c family protein
VAFGQSEPLERADVAAAEDGRTPLNTYTKGRGNSLPPPRPFLDPLETSNNRTCPPIGLGEAAAHYKGAVRSAPDLPRRIRQIQSFASLVLLCLLLTQQGALGAEQNKRGREIFRQLCVKCHGRNGEGVKGKYDDALRGDWPIEKLTRYIDKNMPDDAPEKCVGPDAETVARYIYDAFYSREARLRNHPPRVELVRLTNRQYLNTVADLIKHFTGNDATASGERGLRASYYSSRNLNRGSNVLERVDRQVNFDFGEGFPDQVPAGTNGFSIQWRGSVIAEETGDYEFMLKTPNGARLWVNGDDQTLIDAWVASGKIDEHKATLRLIGGRSYPLRLDCFKFKDKTASMSLQWKPPHGVQEVIPARNLSSARVTPTLVITTPFPPDDSSVGYERGVAVSKAWDEATTQAAIEVANYIVKHLDRLSNSKPNDTNRAASVEAFCSEFVAAAFRRPLTADQKRLFVSSQFKKAGKAEDAFKRVVLLSLKSPRFLYLGLDDAKPDDFAVAERLSFGLWDSLPDKELNKAAAEGRLHTREQVIQHADRMLGDARARAKVQYFLRHWLQMDRVENLSKDDKLYPGFTPEIIADLRTSLDVFLEDAVWNGNYRQLLLADYLYVNERLAKFYGVETNAADDFVKVMFDPKQRSGVVTHPYLLAAFSYQKSTSPIHRGVFLTRNIVGRALKPPPMAMTFKDADFAPNLTMREKVAQLTRSQACQSCHSVINPLGFSLEQYDAVGRFRTSEGDRPIDAVSDYTTDDGETVRLTGARDLAQFAAGSEQAQNAFIEQLFNHVVKQPMLAYGPNVLNHFRQSFIDSGFNVKKLLVDIATISARHGIEKPQRGS